MLAGELGEQHVIAGLDEGVSDPGVAGIGGRERDKLGIVIEEAVSQQISVTGPVSRIAASKRSKSAPSVRPSGK